MAWKPPKPGDIQYSGDGLEQAVRVGTKIIWQKVTTAHPDAPKEFIVRKRRKRR